MAKKMAHGVAGKEGGQKLEEGASLGLLHPNTVEARDRCMGMLGTLPVFQSAIIT